MSTVSVRTGCDSQRSRTGEALRSLGRNARFQLKGLKARRMQCSDATRREPACGLALCVCACLCERTCVIQQVNSCTLSFVSSDAYSLMQLRQTLRIK